jgi:hypothetical protein
MRYPKKLSLAYSQGQRMVIFTIANVTRESIDAYIHRRRSLEPGHITGGLEACMAGPL